MTRDPDVTSRIMGAVRSTGTRPEMALRRELHRRGLRYRVSTTVMGKPDLVFVGARVACFVDGDRWHGNGWRVRGYDSFESEFDHANSLFWKNKITRNMQRDQDVTARLRIEGWVVFRAWASDVERDVPTVADELEAVVRGRLTGRRR
jgi:DNA mismatch endonuclease (patch repair protein)